MTGTGITVFLADSGETHTVDSNHTNFNQICKAVSAGEFDDVLAMISPKAAMEKFTYNSPEFKIEGGQVFYKDRLIKNYACDIMIEMAMKDMDVSYIEKFLANLYDNPSRKAVNDLYKFLEKGQLPITPDGHFVAYKVITEDFKDCRTSTFDNSIGSIVEMERNEVDEDADRLCSYGLHFCSLEYIGWFSNKRNRVVAVKINPRDVVAITPDHNESKGRCCKYEVLREMDGYYDPEAADREDAEREARQREELHHQTIYGYDDDEYEENNLDEDECYACGETEEYCDCHEEENDNDDEVIIAINTANGVEYEYGDVEEASDQTGIRADIIEEVLADNLETALGYTFEWR